MYERETEEGDSDGMIVSMYSYIDDLKRRGKPIDSALHRFPAYNEKRCERLFMDWAKPEGE